MRLSELMLYKFGIMIASTMLFHYITSFYLTGLLSSVLPGHHYSFNPL